MAAEAIPAGAREFEEAAPAFGEAAPEPSTGATIIGEVVGSFILSFLGIGIGAAAFVSGQFARGDSRVGTATLLGHAPVLPTALARRDGRGDADIDLVMGDMGGTMYDDDNTAQANLKTIRELTAAGFDEREFWRIYDDSRHAQSAMQRARADRFLGGEDSRLRDLAEHNVEFRPESLYADVRPTLEVLATRYKLGIASNSSPIQEALRRDGLLDYFRVVATPETSGVDKTDAAFWRWALEQGGASPERAVHVGNRLDSDIRPVKQVGVRAVWLLRGEAPPAPTLEQLSEPTAAVTSFSGLPSALAGMATSRVPAGAV